MAERLPVPISRRPTLLVLVTICIVIASVVLLAFFGVWDNNFVDYDDNNYVFLNPYVTQGISWETIRWASTHIDACHWVPLTWLSHALDCQLFGLKASGHHTTNLLIHCANVVLLFLLLNNLTGSLWRSAVVAMLFGVHPLRVESVAWVAERKDVLSGLFFMLALLAYVQYVRKLTISGSPVSPSEFGSSKRPAYWLALLFFGCGLLSKPMLVTLPFLLLLLDFWPLRRLDLTAVKSNSTQFLVKLRPLLREKIPFFAFSVIVSLVTFLAQEETKASAGIPLIPRLGNVVLACVSYLRQTIWPGELSVFYPLHQVTLLTPFVVFGALLLLGLTIIAIRVRISQPWITVGWFWFLGVLLPASGVVQAADAVQADRFTYLPSIGLFILLVWSFATLASDRQWLRIPLGALAAGVVIWFGVLTHRQVALWKGTRSLFTHAAKVTKNNHVALTFLANFEIVDGRLDNAKSTLEQVLQFAPGFPRAEYLLASILQMQGKTQDAIPHLERSTGAEVMIPSRARMAISFIDGGRFAEADAILDQLVVIAPGSADVALMRAATLRNQGQINDAVELFRKVTAAQMPPLADNPTMNFEIAELLGMAGDNRNAARFYDRAVEQFPDFAKALNNYAWLLATDSDNQLRNGARAVELAERASRLTGHKQPIYMGTLAAAYAEAGRFDDAVTSAQQAKDKAQLLGQVQLANRNGELLELYRQRRPYRESPK